jgi:hypothetical protein
VLGILVWLDIVEDSDTTAYMQLVEMEDKKLDSILEKDINLAVRNIEDLVSRNPKTSNTYFSIMKIKDKSDSVIALLTLQKKDTVSFNQKLILNSINQWEEVVTKEMEINNKNYYSRTEIKPLDMEKYIHGFEKSRNLKDRLHLLTRIIRNQEYIIIKEVAKNLEIRVNLRCMREIAIICSRRSNYAIGDTIRADVAMAEYYDADYDVIINNDSGKSKDGIFKYEKIAAKAGNQSLKGSITLTDPITNGKKPMRFATEFNVFDPTPHIYTKKDEVLTHNKSNTVIIAVPGYADEDFIITSSNATIKHLTNNTYIIQPMSGNKVFVKVLDKKTKKVLGERKFGVE